MIISRQSTQSPWFRVFRPRPQATARLACLPHAGGAASFFSDWSLHLPDAIELVTIQYPGRQERLGEPMIGRMSDLIAALVHVMPIILDRPYVLFGHSMGAAVAHELCLALAQKQMQLPERLIVSAREAPQHNQAGTLHSASDPVFCERLLALGITPPQLLQSEEWRQLMLPVIRNDYQLIETYLPSSLNATLPIPLSAFAGNKDSELTIEQAADWSSMTSGSFQLRVFEGGHFYLCDHRAAVIAEAIQSLRSLAPLNSCRTADWPSTP